MRTDDSTKVIGLPPRPRGVALEDRIEIDASAEHIWQILADVESWGRWNPIYPEAIGSVAVGDPIRLTIALPGMKPQKSTATVLLCEPAKSLQFGAPAFAGLLLASRYIDILPQTAGRCTVINGEAFSRLLGGLLVRMLGAKIAEGLRLQNAGLKAAAEAHAHPQTG